MINVRPAAVAGTFYTDDPRQLRRQVTDFLHAGGTPRHAAKAIIAPHAGYVYSGAVAGSAYAAVAPLRERITQVVLLGPAHRVPVPGIAASSAASFASPLGAVAVNQEKVRAVVQEFDFVQYLDAAHDLEHSLEVQLPFLQVALGEFALLPFAVGGASPPQVERLLEHLWGGDETLIVISSDLSHYHDYQTARALDQRTAERIAAFDPAGIRSEDACGQLPIRGLLRAAVRHGLSCETLDLRNSGDTAGPSNRVVGYGAFAFYEPDECEDTDKGLRRRLTELARDSIGHGIDHGTAKAVDPAAWPESVTEPGASFVTLNLDGRLRGCMGSLLAHRPLVEDITENAYAAAFKDPRFGPLERSEFPRLALHISRLSAPEPMVFGSAVDLLQQLRPGVDGLILTEGSRRATFLPAVWRTIPERHAFLAQLKRKAGLAEDYWSDTVAVSRYTTESW